MDTKATGLQSDPQFYHNIEISKNFLTMQKKLLTISIIPNLTNHIAIIQSHKTNQFYPIARESMHIL